MANQAQIFNAIWTTDHIGCVDMLSVTMRAVVVSPCWELVKVGNLADLQWLRNEVHKDDFLRVIRNIVGDQMLKQAAHKVFLQPASCFASPPIHLLLAASVLMVDRRRSTSRPFRREVVGGSDDGGAGTALAFDLQIAGCSGRPHERYGSGRFADPRCGENAAKYDLEVGLAYPLRIL
nr:unnamed protein product [Digitaria exilis]